MATTVIIPARNEERTIGKIVSTFNQHFETQGNVYVGIDADTKDRTGRNTINAGGTPIRMAQRGKGQVVTECVNVLAALPGRLSGRVILCDGDYTGLTTEHINLILKPQEGMVIGVPDWPEITVPPHVIDAWPKVSGFRCLPWKMVPMNAHGYLLETQLNVLAAKSIGLWPRYVFMRGLKSPFQWPLSEQRMAELKRDREWGERNGVLS
jgi:hypothetical protein